MNIFRIVGTISKSAFIFSADPVAIRASYMLRNYANAYYQRASQANLFYLLKYSKVP